MTGCVQEIETTNETQDMQIHLENAIEFFYTLIELKMENDTKSAVPCM